MKPNLYTRLYLWLVARRWPVLTVVLVVTVASIFISSRIDLEEDILDMLPHNDARVDEYRYALRKFRQIDRIYLDVSVKAPGADGAKVEASAQSAKANCPLSRVLKAAISMEARLDA